MKPEALKPDLKKIKRQKDALSAEVVDKMSSLATAAFGLVAALAWNNAIQAVFKRYYPTPDDPNALLPLVGYACVVTVVSVLIILWIGRVAGGLKATAEAPPPPSPPS